VTKEILLPKLGFAIEEGTLLEWLAADGSQVTQGEPLYLLESDKSTTEIEAPVSGRLHIIAEVGQIYPVGYVLGEIV